jgi:hypothetical protein
MLVSLAAVSPSLAEAKTKSQPTVVTANQVQCNDINRFQLFQGEYTSFDLKRKETNVHQAVFLLDSRTGEVKRYINKIDENGRYIETWLPTDLPSAEKRRPAQEGK